jgi:hypothetical protein
MLLLPLNPAVAAGWGGRECTTPSFVRCTPCCGTAQSRPQHHTNSHRKHRSCTPRSAQHSVREGISVEGSIMLGCKGGVLLLLMGCFELLQGEHRGICK